MTAKSPGADGTGHRPNCSRELSRAIDRFIAEPIAEQAAWEDRARAVLPTGAGQPVLLRAATALWAGLPLPQPAVRPRTEREERQQRAWNNPGRRVAQ
jgi:hypothetical protein